MLAGTKRLTAAVRPSTGQDILKGRRTEIDFINGLVAAKGNEVGVPAPSHAAITRVVVKLADELCEGRVVSVLEGGYRLDGLADSVTAHVKALQGR